MVHFYYIKKNILKSIRNIVLKDVQRTLVESNYVLYNEKITLKLNLNLKYIYTTQYIFTFSLHFLFL